MLDKDEIQQIVTALEPVIKAELAKQNPARAKKMYSRKAFEACMKATGEGRYEPYGAQVLHFQKEWEG